MDNKMKNLCHHLKYTLFITLSLLLTACGSTPQPQVSLQTNIFSKNDLKVGVYYIEPKKEATTHIYGAGCLLCYGVASALTGSLDSHLEKNIDTSELDKIKELVISQYKQRTTNVEEVTLSTPINKLQKFKGELGFAKKDFRTLKDSLDVDVLVVLDIYRHGAYRTFANYIPTADPKGHVSGIIYTIDLNTNGYIQYLPFNQSIQPAGEWDEGPSYPSVTTSYYQAIENVKEIINRSI